MVSQGSLVMVPGTIMIVYIHTPHLVSFKLSTMHLLFEFTINFHSGTPFNQI